MVTTMEDEKVIVSAQLDKRQRDELLRLARDADCSLSAEVRRAVTAHLERATPDPAESR